MIFFTLWEENWENKTAHNNYFRLRRFDGEYREMRASTFPVFDGNNNFLYFQGYNIDITEQLATEKERLKLTTQLQQAQKMEAVGTLAGGIAHDFNNILSAILGYSQMARDELPDDHHIRADLDQVIVAAHRAADLVNQILTFSRQKEKSFQPLNVHSVIREVLKLLRASLPTTIELKESIHAGCGPIMADPIKIHQILMNLCTNAKDAIGENIGTMNISLSEVHVTETNVITDCQQLAHGAYLDLKVGDTGHGMDGLVLSRIFDPFFTTKGVDKGTGLGLSVVHGIVKQHRGDIAVASEPGQGTTFHIYLPILEETMQVEQGIKSDVPRGNERILFVDDEMIIAEMMQRMLERLGYIVTIVTSSVEALDLYAENPDDFDLVITDMTMPMMSGITLTQKLLALQPDLPVILCTGFSEAIDESKVRTLGIREYIRKPALKRTVAEAIRRALGD